MTSKRDPADPPARPEWTDAPVAWRTGHKNARNLYYVTAHGEDIHVGVMFTEALGLYVADQLNRRDTASPPLPGGDIGTPARRDN